MASKSFRTTTQRFMATCPVVDLDVIVVVVVDLDGDGDVNVVGNL